MSSLENFIFTAHTFEGYPIVGAGICPSDHAKKIPDLPTRFSSIVLDTPSDPFLIDYQLACFAGQVFPDFVYAVGISIYVPDASDPAGGVIGNPHMPIRSAEGMSECIGNRLSIAAYPGGPGIIIEGSPSQAEEAVSHINPGDQEPAALYHLVEAAVSAGIRRLIVVSDGAGTTSPGCVISFDEGILQSAVIEGFAVRRQTISNPMLHKL